MHCHLLIPGLFPPHPLATEIGTTLRLPALECLLARGTKQTQPAGDIGAWLCQAFGVAQQQDWPVAPIALLADGSVPGTDYWLRADPVHLRISRDKLILADSRTFALSAEEAKELLATLNQHFSGDGWRFSAPHPERWYLRLTQPPKVITHSLARAAGDYVDAHMPEGTDAPRWRAALNEIQMLLHEHAVNTAREARGEPEINSLWFWGGGALQQTPHSPFSRIAAEDALACIFAQASQTPCAPLPLNPHAWLTENRSEKNVLAVLHQLDVPASYGDAQGWVAAIQELERHWFAPLRQALANGRVKQITLHIPGMDTTHEISICRRDLWKVWRRKKVLLEKVG